ncbi:hypothetical protein DYI95_010205 [Thermaerobacter sp. PB12/4term]|uniref:hypothetical protein n=1 Tax=Thermaerobacter sp. PB12/4term TaxID=2293838 RepID=UPI000E327556|nr:hypothetical protein [Thermaerobacter sp. PB12/4term]QIA27835.1 hypothetical protein DYI95_010205 [Thermaerobacter sp. PB12/4term]
MDAHPGAGAPDGRPEPTVLEQQLLIARANLRGYLMLFLRYARERGDSPESLARYLGDQVAQTWGPLRRCSGIEFAQALAQMVTAGGDRVVTVREEGGIACLELEPPPEDGDLLAAFGIDRDQWHAFYYGQFERIATRLGLRCAHQREGDLHRFYFARIARNPGGHRPLRV